MSTQIKSPPKPCVRTPRAKKPTRPTLTKASTTPTGRSPDGRFAKDNPGGPGNPHARHCARMLALLRTSISDEEMVAIIRKLVEKAVAGDVSAAKLLMSYKLGKPAPAPNPDQIDRDKWEHYQKDAINLEEIQQVLGSLPSKVGNDIARTALPIVTEARKEALATNLVKNVPVSHKPAKETEFAIQTSQHEAPIQNGDSDAGNEVVRKRDEKEEREGPQPAGKRKVPIPNRKSSAERKGKGKSKKVKPAWIEHVARRIQKTGTRVSTGGKPCSAY